MSGAKLVVVGVPVWQGAAFVGETLQSILEQSHSRFRVIVSVDGADADSERACRPFLSDSRVKIIVLPNRLGWVANTAILYAAAVADGASYACIQPHDDVLDRQYLAALVEAIETHPRAAVVYSDIQPFGLRHKAIIQRSVTGPPVGRMLTLLHEHFNAVAYRGLIRAATLTRVRPISGNPFFDFAADTVWMTRLASVGDLVRVPQLLYRKRYHARNTHGAWTAWSRSQRIAGWKDHCLRMLAEALAVAPDLATRLRLVEAARARLLDFRHQSAPEVHASARERLAAEFDLAAGEMLKQPGRPTIQ